MLYRAAPGRAAPGACLKYYSKVVAWLQTYEARLNYIYMLLLTDLEIILSLRGVCTGSSMVKIVDLKTGVEYKRVKA
jgi:hypothetical protein